MEPQQADLSPSAASRPEGASRRLWPALAVLLVVVVVVLAFLVLWSRRLRVENSPEVIFARAMAAHHAQAVEMALILLERTTDPELRQFVLDIILTQQAQIGQMQGWLAAWDLPLNGPQPPMTGHDVAMTGMASQAEVNELRTLPVSDAETRFLQLMIRHHQGGVVMAEAALRQVTHPEVTRLAQSIVDGQQSEIEYMQELLER